MFPRLQSGSAQISHVTAAAELRRQTPGVFLPRLHQSNPTTAVLPPVTLTSGVKAENGPTKKKKREKRPSSFQMTLHRGGQAAFSVQPFQYGLGDTVTAIILSAEHLSSTHWRCAPHPMLRWNAFFFFLWHGLRAPSPPCFSLSCHASHTKLLHTASPWLPLALSICLPSTWRTLQL